MNLAAKTFLFSANAEDFDEVIIVNRTLRKEQIELREWRKYDFIGKLHNIVVGIRRSPQRKETFLKLLEVGDDFAELMLIQDNVTR